MTSSPAVKAAVRPAQARVFISSPRQRVNGGHTSSYQGKPGAATETGRRQAGTGGLRPQVAQLWSLVAQAGGVDRVAGGRHHPTPGLWASRGREPPEYLPGRRLMQDSGGSRPRLAKVIRFTEDPRCPR